MSHFTDWEGPGWPSQLWHREEYAYDLLDRRTRVSNVLSSDVADVVFDYQYGGWRGRSASAEAPERVRERVGTRSGDRQGAGSWVE